MTGAKDEESIDMMQQENQIGKD